MYQNKLWTLGFVTLAIIGCSQRNGDNSERSGQVIEAVSAERRANHRTGMPSPDAVATTNQSSMSTCGPPPVRSAHELASLLAASPRSHLIFADAVEIGNSIDRLQEATDAGRLALTVRPVTMRGSGTPLEERQSAFANVVVADPANMTVESSDGRSFAAQQQSSTSHDVFSRLMSMRSNPIALVVVEWQGKMLVTNAFPLVEGKVTLDDGPVDGAELANRVAMIRGGNQS